MRFGVCGEHASAPANGKALLASKGPSYVQPSGATLNFSCFSSFSFSPAFACVLSAPQFVMLPDSVQACCCTGAEGICRSRPDGVLLQDESIDARAGRVERIFGLHLPSGSRSSTDCSGLRGGRTVPVSKDSNGPTAHVPHRPAVSNSFLRHGGVGSRDSQEGLECRQQGRGLPAWIIDGCRNDDRPVERFYAAAVR